MLLLCEIPFYFINFTPWNKLKITLAFRTYFIVASRMVRPGQIYKISVNILQTRLQMTIRASISCFGVEIADVIQRVKQGVPEILNMRVRF